MPLNYKKGTDSQSAITATTTAPTAIDASGFSQVAAHAIFGTCTGTASETCAISIQTSNDNQTWATLGTIVSATQGSSLSGTNTFDYFPDNATANAFGFGTFIRFVATLTSGASITYNIKWHLKE